MNKISKWTAGQAIKARRKALGLSLEDLASTLGVSKAYLSYVESDERILAEEQAAVISEAIGIPLDLLLLSSGKLPGDVHRAISSDAASITAAVRQRSEQHAVQYPSELQTAIPDPAKRTRTYSPAGIPERISVSKASSSYRAHSYHTKVPPEAITPFIRALSEPGDVVLDLFCGSGMTGVAALNEGRHAILADLSPAAVHIARNYTSFCDPSEFTAAMRKVADTVEPTMRWLYCPVEQKTETVEYTTWSDVFRCPECSEAFAYWDVVQSAAGLSGGQIVSCPHCQSEVRKGELEWLSERPVQTHVSSGGSRIKSHHPTPGELMLIEAANTTPIPYWVPEVPFGPEREMWRASHRAMGIAGVKDFFTRRNLHALAALRHAIVTTAEGRTREALMFAFTACVNRASRRYQWNAKRPTNVMTGTLYISSLRYEWNVWSLFRRKAADVRRYYEKYPKKSSTVQVINRSATDLSCIPDGSVSMVFLDPPFGSNIFYADSSLLWEAWMGSLTDTGEEIVVNKSRGRIGGGKTLEDYGKLMTKALSEVARTLRPDGYAVLAFSNSDDKVWLEIQNAIQASGMQTETVHILDKGQPSIKGVKGVAGKEKVTRYDLLITMRHSKKTTAKKAPTLQAPISLVDEETLSALRIGSARTDDIYSQVIQSMLSKRKSLSGVTMPLIEERIKLLGAQLIEGKWTLEKEIGGNLGSDTVADYLSDPSSLPVSSRKSAPTKPPNRPLVPGGRNSAFYTAHSYHTKVPPEAITPFIEHFTKPGDVVLDLFCGSGMTGVAAALSGRRAILNDLSPAAIHLAWNHTHECSPAELQDAFSQVETKVQADIDRIYRTAHIDGEKATINWTMWSTRHQCPACRKKFLLWDAIDRTDGRMGSSIDCPECGTSIVRRDLKAIDSVPAWISYTTQSGKRSERAAEPKDVRRARSFKREDISSWYPSVPIGPDREMYIRCALQLKDVHEVADFYTPRNLHALSLIWEAICEVSDRRLRLALAFAFTNTAWHGTRMRRFNARGGQRPLTGTLYIPQLSSEVNVLDVLRNKIAQLKRYYSVFRPKSVAPPSVINGSATSLKQVKDNTIDYIFTDPPFGSNLFYADCNLIWESWLGRITNPSKEVVVNRSLDMANGGKTLDVYEALMTQSMKEMIRVLKPGGWATVVFHNSDGQVWDALHKAADGAGFEFHEAASLDRKQQSHKGYKGRSGQEDVAHFDVVMNLRKPLRVKATAKTPAGITKRDLRKLVLAAAEDVSVSSRGLQAIHAEVVRRLISRGERVFFDYSDVRKIWQEIGSDAEITA
ncbi:DNA methyltransferase [Gilvimarinus sp. F26214L]|uniref:DNA methyltransferase n=1 Tax=Gilvimarinus sp. DZF01 TaxID=3461371 RepID=UPI0040463D32